MDFMGTTTTPLRIFRQVSHKVPMSGPEIELGGTSVSIEEICDRVSRSDAATLGESNPFSLDMASAQKQAAALRAGKRITGHTALLENEPLWGYCAVSSLIDLTHNYTLVNLVADRYSEL